jgi:hypothetical protein
MKLTGAVRTVKRILDEFQRQISGEYERQAEATARLGNTTPPAGLASG